MENIYLDIIRQGLSAHDTSLRLPGWLHSVVGDWSHEKRRAHHCADAITRRLRAIKAVEKEACKTILAQIAAEARIDRLLNKPQPTVQVAEPDEQLEQKWLYLITNEARRLRCDFIERRQWEWGPPTLDAYRRLIKNVDALSSKYPDAIGKRIVRSVVERLNW